MMPRTPCPGALLALLLLAAALPCRAERFWVYFGTSAVDSHKGIYRSLLDTETGQLSAAVRATDKSNSVFFAFSPDRSYLYGLSDVRAPGSQAQEAVETYRVNARDGSLTSIGEQVPGGTEGCHINIDPSGRCVLTTNYNNAYAEVFRVLPDGTVGARTGITRFQGSGPRKDRQQSSHPHSVNFDPSGKFAIICDLGQDKVFVFRLDLENGRLVPNEPAFAAVHPGAGPRHFAFHPDKAHAFSINELDGTITAFQWDAARGVLTPYQDLAILPRDYSGPTNTSAEVVVSGDGRFVYGSNRGHDSLVVSRFDPKTGALTLVQTIHTGVQVPRNYAIDPTGRWLVCGNLTANTVSVFSVDAANGTLTFKGSVDVPEPLCVRFLKVQ